MRSLMVIIALLLSGCASSDPPSAQEETLQEGPETVLQEIQVDVVSGTEMWHDPDRDMLAPYNLAVQPVAHPCAWDEEAYFNNLPLGSSGFRDPIPNGTDTLIVTFSWEVTDSHLESLVLGYQPPGYNTVLETEHILNGETTELKVKPSKEDGWWTFWACVSNAEDPEFIDDRGPRWFWGELTWDIDAIILDEVPASDGTD